MPVCGMKGKRHETQRASRRLLVRATDRTNACLRLYRTFYIIPRFPCKIPPQKLFLANPPVTSGFWPSESGQWKDMRHGLSPYTPAYQLLGYGRFFQSISPKCFKALATPSSSTVSVT